MKFPLYLVLFLLFIGCSDDNPSGENEPKEPSEPELVSYFTYESNSSFDNQEKWIVIHDMDGKLLDFSEVMGVTKLDFTINKDSVPESVQVTELTSNNFYHYLTTYANIAPYSTWYDDQYASHGNIVGSFNIKVENILDYKSYTLSNEKRPLRAELFNDDEVDGKTTLDFMGVPLYEGQECILSILDTNGHTGYFTIQPEDQADYIYDFENITDFDAYLQVSLPETDWSLAFSSGFKNIDDAHAIGVFGQVFFEFWNYDRQGLNLAYLDGYEKYKTYISYIKDKFQYTINILGDIPEQIVFPARPSFEVISPSIYDFRFQSDLNPIRKMARYEIYSVNSQNENLNTFWEVFSNGEDNLKLGELPAELLNEFPNINLENLELNRVMLVTKGNTQQEYFKATTSKSRIGDYTDAYFTFYN